MNRLTNEKSAYLQRASHQKINWHPWSEKAFDTAKQEDKLVFLSSGAIWCHWCHVMAKECFDDDEVARLLNDLFVPVKLDRDERPDIDKRYQLALAAMGISGGWPMSIFLTPDKKPFFGGTYFPLEERFGRPGFKTILQAINQLYRDKKETVHEHGERFHDFLKNHTAQPGGPIDKGSIDRAVQVMLQSLDKAYGGFGFAPKFAMSGAIEFLIWRYNITKDETIGDATRKTLIAMARGGIHDQLGGGFHRYSTDMTWSIPHFEKMADDNAWLLRNYADAYAVFRDGFFQEVAWGIIRFLRDELSHPDGGFYASQDADVMPEDEGGYFLWKERELKQILNDDEYRILSEYFFHERGKMPQDASKTVLSAIMSIDDFAGQAAMDPGYVRAIMDSGKEKLLREREKREKPFIDKAMYTSLNGMVISAFFRAYRVMGGEQIRQFATKSLDRILALNVSENNVSHIPGVKGFLDDYVNLVDCLISAFQGTGEQSYLDRAAALMSTSIEKFWDREDSGFFDTEDEVIGIRLKSPEDTPRPSANSVAILCLLGLAAITGDEEYRRYAEEALRRFSNATRGMGVHGGFYFRALDEYFG